MRKPIHMYKEVWMANGSTFGRYWCGMKVLVKGQIDSIDKLTSLMLGQDGVCRNCIRAKTKPKTFRVTSGHNYSGKLGTIPALFRFKKCYHLSKGKRVEFMEKLGQDQGRWLTGIVDDFIDQPNHKYIFISRH